MRGISFETERQEKETDAVTATQSIVVVVALVVVAAIAYVIFRRQRTTALRGRFGPEYQRAVETHGDQAHAESALAKREKRVERMQIRPLAADEASRYADQWRVIQARFVDDPAAAIGDADRLVAQLMEARGYPIADFDQRAADISVDHPEVVNHYRSAHEIAGRHQQKPVTTEELRKAFLHYRELFSSLLKTDAKPTERPVEAPKDARPVETPQDEHAEMER